MTEDLLAKINKIANAYWVERDRRVTTWEGDFVTEISKRYEKFGTKTFVSEKQAAVINKIAAKLV
ncbi:MAG: hypothetical protein JWM58_1642 [Rhizobium sp.]|nr:hypothetical protein [Rhizobium sp.]